MATATSTSAASAQMPLRQKLGYAFAVIAVLFSGWVIYNFDDIKGQAQLGASYGAHIACSCRYIEGRSLGSCKTDFEPGMGMVSLSDDPEHQRVRASVPLLAEAYAEKRGDFGCLQLTEAEIEAMD